jgi:hypothetical protein
MHTSVLKHSGSQGSPESTLGFEASSWLDEASWPGPPSPRGVTPVPLAQPAVASGSTHAKRSAARNIEATDD